MDSGFMALSIYCVQMAPKWSCVLDSQPIQGKDMSVQVYYDQFCSWRSKLEAVNYIGDEEWYVDDFLCGLKMDLVVRVLGYKWRARRLSDAFRRAEIEEIMLSWKENSRKNDADEVFEEMSHPESVNSVELQGAMDISDENSDDVLDVPSFVATKEGFSNMFDTKTINSVEKDVFGLGDLDNEAIQMLENLIEPFQAGNSPLIKAETKLVDQDKQTFPAGIVTATCKLFNEMTQPFLAGLQFPYSWHLTAGNEGNDCPSTKIRGLDVHQLFDEGPVKLSLERIEENDDNNSIIQPIHEGKLSFATKINDLEIVCHMFDELPAPFSVKHNNGIDRHEELVLPTFDLLRMSGCDFFDSNVLPTFDLLRMSGCDFFDSNGVKQYFDKMLNDSIVELWVGEVLLFIIDPGGNSFINLSCEPFDSTSDKHNLGEFSENRGRYSLGMIWEVILEGFKLNPVGSGLKPGDLDVDNMTSRANKLEMPWALAVCAEFGGQDKNCEEIEVLLNDCHPMESNNEEQDFDKLMRINVDSHCTTIRLKAWPKVAIVLGLVPLMLVHLPQSAIHSIPVVFCIDDHRIIWNTLKQLVANFLFPLVALWASGCLHLADAVNANVLNVELWFELYKAFQIEIQAAFCTVTSWIGSGSSTTISTGVRLVPLLIALGRKNWLASNPSYFHLNQEHIPTAFWGRLVDWCQYGRVSCPLGKGFRFVTGVSQGQDDRVGNIIPTAKAGGAAILYDWDAQNVYIVMKLPQEYMETEARELNNSGMAELTPLVALFIKQVHIIELYEAVLGMVTLYANMAVVPYVMEIEDCSLIINVENFIWDPGLVCHFFFMTTSLRTRMVLIGWERGY